MKSLAGIRDSLMIFYCFIIFTIIVFVLLFTLINTYFNMKLLKSVY